MEQIHISEHTYQQELLGSRKKLSALFSFIAEPRSLISLRYSFDSIPINCSENLCASFESDEIL